MSDLPNGSIPSSWAWAKVQDIATTATGGTPSRTVSEYFGGDIPWVKSGELGDGHVFDTEESLTEVGLRSSNAKLFPKGTLCIALYGATVGKLGILEVAAATNQAVCGIFLPSAIHRDYLFHYLASIRRHLIEQGKGGAQSNISNGLVRQTWVPIAPESEQRRIVAKIEELFSDLDAGVAALERAKANLKRYRAAVLKDAVEGKLTEAWRAEHPETEPAAKLLDRILAERRLQWEADQLAKFAAAGKVPPKNWQAKYVEPAAPDLAGMPCLPEGWTFGSLEQLTSASRPICYGILMPKENVSDGVLYVKVKDMKGDRINLASLHRTRREIADEYSRAALKPGDLLLAIRGTYGRIAEVPPELDGGNITQDTARLAIASPLECAFIAACLRASSCQTYFKRVARGVAVKGVNIGDVRLCPIPVCSVKEQREIVTLVAEKLSQIDAAEEFIVHGLLRASRLRQSILKQAFEGKLVPQDPNDEPASALLERLRA